ncbi:hypothetical protein E2C01_044105 [Portunus trituberculatus]|uniref:Uncharacterized protein n=1 Tax=Portunus trituberculatus TaxID=210409 RepID=A0A5B7FS93_PORTR|nr:hypothetical protein [Portunus trituberculatus]
MVLKGYEGKSRTKATKMNKKKGPLRCQLPCRSNSQPKDRDKYVLTSLLNEVKS